MIEVRFNADGKPVVIQCEDEYQAGRIVTAIQREMIITNLELWLYSESFIIVRTYVV